MSNQPSKPTAHAPARAAGNPASEPAERRRHDEDELHVPRGVSRGVGLFLIGLMIFLLVIWLVPNAMFGIAGGSETRNPISVRFQVPGEGEVAWRASEVQNDERALRDALELDGILAMLLGINMRQPDPKELVRVMVLDRIAQAAGVEITDTDLAAHIRESLSFQRGTDEDFVNAVRARGWDQRAIEESIRRLLRVQRFQQLVGYAGAVPDPRKIEEQWHQENVEFAFDYVVLPVESLREEARRELPDDAGLQAWFDKLSDGEKEEFKSPEKRKAEVAYFRDLETTPATGLLGAFPEQPAEGAQPTPPDELANQYYNRVFGRRFQKPKEEGQSGPQEFFPFDEVKAVCLAEAPVYFAIQRWLEDLNARRAKGETIDLAAEAQEYGLEHLAFTDALTSEEVAALPDVGDRDLAAAIFATEANGSFYAAPIALAKGIFVVRTNERTERALPPFAEIRDKVAEKWLGPRSEELARKRLAALREGLESFEPAPKEGEEPPAKGAKKEAHHRATGEAFRAAAEAAGLTVATRDFLNKAGPATQDPQSAEADHRELFSQAHALGLYDLETDEIAAPGFSGDHKRAYLVRLAGKRDVPLENMSPTQYARYKQSARSRAMGEIGQQLDLDFLRKNYGLWLYEDEQAAKAQAKKP